MKAVTFIILLTLSFLGGYFFRSITTKRETDISLAPIVTSSPEQTSIPTDEEAITNLVNTFEEHQKQREAIEVVKLFTPPASPQEASDYVFLMGLDLPGADFPRLYATAGLGYKLIKHKVLNIKLADRSSLVEIEELRSMHDNTSGQWSDDPKKVYVFELEKVGGNYMVAKYYPRGGSAEKYKGFY